MTEVSRMSEKRPYVTVVDGFGEKTIISKVGLEKYKKQMSEALEKTKQLMQERNLPLEGLKAFEIVSVEE